MEIRNIAIIAQSVAASRLLENPRFSTGFALLSDTGKLEFSRSLQDLYTFRTFGAQGLAKLQVFASHPFQQREQ